MIWTRRIDEYDDAVHGSSPNFYFSGSSSYGSFSPNSSSSPSTNSPTSTPSIQSKPIGVIFSGTNFVGVIVSGVISYFRHRTNFIRFFHF
jgi:hypothetical protein